MSTGQANTDTGGEERAFETRDFYLACFLRCTGYDLLDLRAEVTCPRRSGPPVM